MPSKAAELTIYPSVWRLFAIMASVFTIGSAPILFFLPSPPLIVVIFMLFGILVACPVGALVIAPVFAYALTFQIIDGKLQRQGLARGEEINIDAVVELLHLGLFLRAGSGPFNGVTLPGRVLLDAHSKEELSNYAMQFLSKENPLYGYWTQSTNTSAPR